MDSFFASCEMSIDPRLINKPFAVAIDSRRSIITAANYVAREFGVKSAMPIYKAKKICPDIILKEPNFKLYTNMSEAIFNLIAKDFTNKIEVASIDECYIDVTDIYKKYESVMELAKIIKDKIFKKFNMTCSIGISDNKLLAKMAVSKNKPNGITLWRQEHISTFFWPLKIRELFGVGIATEIVLRDEFNVNVIGDLAKIDQKALNNHFGNIIGNKLKMSALGLGETELNLKHNELNGISNELTLEQPTDNEFELIDMLKELAYRVHERASLRLLEGKTVSLILRNYNKNNGIFDKREHLKHKSFQITLKQPTNDFEIIFCAIHELFLSNWKGETISLIGIRLDNVKPALIKRIQLSLNDINSPFHNSANSAIIDFLNINFGAEVIISGKKIERYFDRNPTQQKYLFLDRSHLSNKDIKNIWKEKTDNDKQ
ncbi:DNA polymerase IV [Spiroplasma endosymbiont of Labia minor]|uniref:Y-family DNA polymerase n=1 Tax=Spiroplasma endosymbiont of Labia minor TaxID=3066305 RepID=UPI0030D12D4E